MSRQYPRDSTREGVEILNQMFVEGDPEMALLVEKYRLDAEVGRALYRLRTEAGLTQQELARRVGTSHSNISRLEDADYEGHSMAMLRRIAAALGKSVVIGFVDRGVDIEPEALPEPNERKSVELAGAE